MDEENAGSMLLGEGGGHKPIRVSFASICQTPGGQAGSRTNVRPVSAHFTSATERRISTSKSVRSVIKGLNSARRS